VSRHACAGNNYLDATVCGVRRKFFYLVWCAMSGQGVHLERNLKFIEQVGSFLHDRKVGGAAHDDANDRSHNVCNLFVG
jgi:hypothetical protein